MGRSARRAHLTTRCTQRRWCDASSLPPPPPGAQPPPLWGDEDHVRALLGDRVTDVTARRQTVTVERFPKREDFRDYFKARYGPTIAVYRSIADDPDKVAALDRELVELVERHHIGADMTVVEWEYLVLTCRRSGIASAS